MDKGAGPLPPAGAPGQPSGGSDDGQGSGKPPPIPPAPDGPGRSYGVPTAAGYPPQGVPAAPGPHGYGGGPPGYGTAGGYPGHGARPGAGGGYGAGAYAPYGWYGPPPPVGKSVAAMVVGIGSVVLVLTCWGSFLAVLSSPVALVLGVSARRAVARGEQGGSGQATAGFVLGIVGLALAVLVSTLLILGLTVWSDDSGGGPGGGDGDSFDARGTRAPVAAVR